METRVYQNHHLDSTRWDAYEPRDGDMVIVTSYKSGTTWMQHILGLLLVGESVDAFALKESVPWIDCRFKGGTKQDLWNALSAMPGRRLLKSHLPLDGLPFYANVRYVIVARDPRDVFMSLFNHYGNYTERAFRMLNEPAGHGGEALPPCPADPRAFWRNWITRGYFGWEHEGWPFWGNLRHTQSYWTYRHLPNMLFVHYGDMLADLAGVVRRVAAFAGIEVCDAEVTRVIEATSFDAIRKMADDLPLEQDKSRFVFKDGLKSFFFKGSNGRWRDVLNDEDLALYEAAKARVLAPDCARWLENGGVIGQPRGGG